MAVIAPLKGVRYDTEVAGSLEDIVTPPYDVISRNEEASYFSRSPFNIIRLDITAEPDAGKDKDNDRYKKPAHFFDQWLKDGILLRDQEPSLYAYDITYTLPDRSQCIRRGFICLVKLTPFEQGDIKPHEQTMAHVVADRLELTKQCRAQFSPVFSIFSDPQGQVMETFGTAPYISVATVADADGTIHTLRKVTDKKIIVKIQNLFNHKSLYIADGHHRYTAALSYQKELNNSGKIPVYRPENFIMMYLCPMEDNGLSIVSPHRLVRLVGAITVSELIDRLNDVFVVEELLECSREAMINELLARMDEEQFIKSGNRSCFGFYHPGEDRGFLLKLKDPLWQDLKGYPTSVRELDVVVFSELIVEQVLQLNEQRCLGENLISFYTDIIDMLDVSVKMATSSNDCTPLLFFLNPMTTEQVINLSDQGLVMPPKSTCFFPHIITGLVMNRLLEDEKILINE